MLAQPLAFKRLWLPWPADWGDLSKEVPPLAMSHSICHFAAFQDGDELPSGWTNERMEVVKASPQRGGTVHKSGDLPGLSQDLLFLCRSNALALGPNQGLEPRFFLKPGEKITGVSCSLTS